MHRSGSVLLEDVVAAGGSSGRGVVSAARVVVEVSGVRLVVGVAVVVCGGVVVSTGR